MYVQLISCSFEAALQQLIMGITSKHCIYQHTRAQRKHHLPFGNGQIDNSRRGELSLCRCHINLQQNKIISASGKNSILFLSRCRTGTQLLKKKLFELIFSGLFRASRNIVHIFKFPHTIYFILFVKFKKYCKLLQPSELGTGGIICFLCPALCMAICLLVGTVQGADPEL